MKAFELIEEITFLGHAPEKTCDTVKMGDIRKEISKVAVCMIPTVDIIRKANEWGADMMIVHEPIFYDHWDNAKGDPVTAAKQKLLEKGGMIIYRYHDHMHFRENDEITEGELYYLGLKGSIEKVSDTVCSIMTLEEPVSALELAKLIEQKLGLAHVRISGAVNKKSTRVALCFGATGSVHRILSETDAQIALAGEICEWKDAEYARDAAALGMNKSLIVMGHVGSERDGMRLLAHRLQKKHTDVEIKYFECDEVYALTRN